MLDDKKTLELDDQSTPKEQKSMECLNDYLKSKRIIEDQWYGQGH